MAEVTPRVSVPPRRISILGATGSVGASTLDLIAHHRSRDSGCFEIEALTAQSRVAELAGLAMRFRPRLAVIGDPSRYGELKAALAGTGIETAAGAMAVEEAALRPADWIMAAIVGTAGLRPAMAALRPGVTLALANKECLVSAGPLFMARVAEAGVRLLPVDSEHNAIFQVFEPANRAAIDRLILTASGGPFRTWTREQMRAATPEQAVAHPRWSMGMKISVDSATLMNKGLELIEAHYLFDMPPSQLDIVVHPQSIVHSLVSYKDGSVLAQMASPDMRTPIAYALGYPQRIEAPAPRLDLIAMGALTFEKADLARFPCLALAEASLKEGGIAPTVLTAANEIAVAAFLKRRLGFLDISHVVEEVMTRCVSGRPLTLTTIEDVLSLDREARSCAEESAKALVS
ncbi:MAG: 1-deoxy-D-xylulose-5-phosphate reductoisomerase [Alphaproteobacteria bacterium]|nr:1-deoxy-D-xylulose-5-phosphate reductoisomerase [Alphaproteobacteria bacterium]